MNITNILEALVAVEDYTQTLHRIPEHLRTYEVSLKIVERSKGRVYHVPRLYLGVVKNKALLLLVNML